MWCRLVNPDRKRICAGYFLVGVIWPEPGHMAARP